MPFEPKIAIIGAGPSGLTLARLLQRNNIPCTVYELESGPSDRNQGGTLDLHPDSGQLALEAAGLMEEFKKKARPEGDAMKLVAPDGRVLLDENENKEAPPLTIETAGRPEIDRIVLRSILLDSLEPGRISWGSKLQRVEAGPGDTYDLHFENGVERGFDLVVGGDGAWSKVRPLVTDVNPHYSGISVIELWTLEVEKRNPWLSDYVGKGSCAMFDEGRALICQRNGNGSIRAYACVRQPEDWIRECGIDWTKPETARTKLVEQYFADCGDDIKRQILESRDELIPRALYMLPVGIKWDSRPGVALLGDAAHLMTVFAGVGVNVAMHDALELANAIIASKEGSDTTTDPDIHDRLAKAVREYETSMFERAKESAEDTWQQTQTCFSKDGGETLREMMEKGGPPPQETMTAVAG